MNLPLDPAVEQLVCDSFAQGPMRAIAIEASDGLLVGGLVIVRGEREFALLCSFLMMPATRPEPKPILLDPKSSQHP